jgi:small subunit ribosomal protein S18
MMPIPKFPSKKITLSCRLCANRVEVIDYKDIASMAGFITRDGRILPAHQTGICTAHQQHLSQAIKRARFMALLPANEK